MNKCRKCKCQTEENKPFCESCKDALFHEKVNKITNRKAAKYHNTKEYSMKVVKENANPAFWSSSHKNCFRASFSKNPDSTRKPESKAHRDKKYSEWCKYRSLGYIVFTELILKNGLRPDLVVVDVGFVFIIEVVNTEKEESIIRKKKEYPFPVEVVYCNNNKRKLQ